MQKGTEDTSIDIITIIPKNQFKFKYIINDGSVHSIRKEKLFDFLKDFILQKDFFKVIDFIQRFRAFVILVEEKQVIELKKEDDSEYYKEDLKNEIFSAIKTRIIVEKEELIPNNVLWYEIEKKLARKKV